MSDLLAFAYPEHLRACAHEHVFWQPCPDVLENPQAN